MKELWTGEFVGRMHVAEVTQQELADEAGVSKGYVCQILNSARNPRNGREMLENAFAAVLRRRRLGTTPDANRTLLLENDALSETRFLSD